MFKKAKSKSEAAVKASFIVAAEIAKAARPFIEREFVKKCIVKVCHIVCPDRQLEFLNVTLSLIQFQFCEKRKTEVLVFGTAQHLKRAQILDSYVPTGV